MGAARFYSEIVLRVVTLLWLITPACVQAASTITIPSLPDAYKGKPGQVVLLDFYATWCGACKWMHPYVQNIEKQVGDSLKVVHIDVDQKQNQALNTKYHIAGTPSYFIYGRRGEPVFQMVNELDPLVIQSEVFRAAGRTPALPPSHRILPRGLSPVGLTWVWFQQPKCCQEVSHLAESAGHLPNLTVNALSTETPGVQSWMKQLGVTHPGSSVLLDPQGRVLFRADADTNPKFVQKYLVLFTEGEVSKTR